MFSLSVRSLAWLLRGGGLVGVILLAGCNALPSVVPVSGTVTYRGKPVEGATVTFSRGNGDRTKGDVAVGTTDANGRYELTTHFTGKASVPGAVPGEYKVTISKAVPPPGMTPTQYQSLVDAATKAGEQGAMVSADKQPPPMVEFFPPPISAPASTKLTAKVETGKSEYNFPLD